MFRWTITVFKHCIHIKGFSRDIHTLAVALVGFVMLDLEDSTVTYTEVSSSFEDLSDIGSPGVDRLPMMPEDPYAYVEAAL
ncbi:hypothetical protein Tco_0134984 [Tanacetum coccineum]